MLETFCQKIQHNYKPTRGAEKNIVQYFNISTMVRNELVKNNTLIKLHKDRLGEDEYFDVSFNILAQDFIFAVRHYLTVESAKTKEISPVVKITNIDFIPSKKGYSFKGGYVNYEAKHRNNKEIGDLGEKFILQYEEEHCESKFKDKIIHSAETEGDGLGFDILSCDDEGNPKYIEVKTTRGKIDTPFYISGTELERSIQEGDNYYLYRLYNFNDRKMTAELQIWQGSLERFCINPTNYEVLLTQVDVR